jgi:hypothetical protein
MEAHAEGLEGRPRSAEVLALSPRPGQLKPSRVITGSAARLDIRVKQPETEHTVNVGKLQSWLDGGGKSPNEQLLKSRLREML